MVMAYERIIYLGPEEELTNVRERLENTNAGSIILVIPPQTQLRSHVGWQLLRSRVRELGLDVLVICSDRQIRAVAKAAGFRVADLLESSPSESLRPINRPVRSDTNKKTTQRTNKQGNSGNKVSRSLRPVQQQMPLPTGNRNSKLSNSDDMNAEFDTADSSTFGIEDVPYDFHDTLPLEILPSPISGAGDQEVREIDSLVEDDYLARRIREEGQSSESGEASSAIENAGTLGNNLEQISKIPQPSEIENDPFAYMEDIQSISLPEQPATTFIHDIDQDIPDILDVPTDVHEAEVEDLGDVGGESLHDDQSFHTSEEQILEGSDDQETPRMYPMPALDSIMRNTVRPSFEDLENENDLLIPSSAIEEQPTRVTSSSQANHSDATNLSSADRSQQPPNYLQPQKKIPTKIETFFWLIILFVILAIIGLIAVGVIPISFRILWYLVTFLIVLFVLIFIWRGYNRSWSAWTGFGSYKGQSAKTLWEWLQLSGIIAIPIIAVLIPLWISALHNQDLQIAQIQHRNDLQVAQNQQQQAILEMYLDRMSDLILNKSLNDPKIAVEMRALVRARTLIALSILDPGRKVILIQFLYKAHLIDAKGAIIDLSGADLRYITLDLAHLQMVLI